MNYCLEDFNDDESKKHIDKIWTDLIYPQAKALNNIIPCEIKNDSQQIIWDNYVSFRNHCKENYMENKSHLLDRHKVCACLMCAILKSEFISCNKIHPDDKLYVLVEQVAITVGFSLLQGFIVNSTKTGDKEKEADEKKKDNQIFKKGFLLPKGVDINHGVYRNNFAIELYFTRKEETYNILSLSHTLYLLEQYTRKAFYLSSKNK